MSDIDDYLADLDETKRRTLEIVRDRIRHVIPDSVECISYSHPAFRVDGKVVAGFAAFKNHLGYLPHSGSVFPLLAKELAGYQHTSGSLHFPIDEPLPQAVVTALVTTRLAQLNLG